MAGQATTEAPIILVPGFWLGAWAWDEVASILRAVASPTGSVRSSMSIRRPESAHRTGIQGDELPLNWNSFEEEENSTA